MHTKPKNTYSLAEFRELRKQREAEPLSAVELERRRALGERSDQILSSQKQLSVAVEELIHRSRRYGD